MHRTPLNTISNGYFNEHLNSVQQIMCDTDHHEATVADSEVSIHYKMFTITSLDLSVKNTF